MVKKLYKDYLHCIYVHYSELDDLIQKFKELKEEESLPEYLVDRKECVIYFNANDYADRGQMHGNDLYKLMDILGCRWEHNVEYKYDIYANFMIRETMVEVFYRNECIILNQNKRDILLERNNEKILVMNLFMWSTGKQHLLQWVNSNDLKLKYENR